MDAPKICKAEKVDSDRYRKARIIEALPGPDGPGGENELFERLAGATICHIGMPENLPLEGGGLAIDYVPSGERGEVRCRVIFAFNENGMWLVYNGR